MTGCRRLTSGFSSALEEEESKDQELARHLWQAPQWGGVELHSKSCWCCMSTCSSSRQHRKQVICSFVLFSFCPQNNSMRWMAFNFNFNYHQYEAVINASKFKDSKCYNWNLNPGLHSQPPPPSHYCLHGLLTPSAFHEEKINQENKILFVSIY